MFLKILLQDSFPRWVKMLIDFMILSITFYIADLFIDLRFPYYSSISYLIYSSFLVILLYLFNAYNSIFRYFNVFESFRLIYAISISSIILVLFSGNFSERYLVNHFLLFFISIFLLVSFRVLIKFTYSKVSRTKKSVNNLMIFGAGNNGVIVKRAFFNSVEYRIICYIDDDKNKIGKNLDGVPIFKLGDKLNKFIADKNISSVIISTEKLSSNRKAFLYNYFQKLSIQVLELPPVKSWINGIPSISRFKEVKIEVLLSRGIIKIDNKKNKLHYNKKTVLVTGAAGSIGSEIIRQILKFNPSKIILIDNAETPMFNIRDELDYNSKKNKILYYVDSVTDKKAMTEIFSEHKIDIIFHAAAYKHVNMMEANPRSAILNNVYGTKLIIDLSIIHKVEKFVLISSDKAVNPTNVMGASKRICELYQASKFDKINVDTKFIITRFGNVLGSNGSVVPIFEKQIEEGGPVTITHPEIERYFMTIPEASQLVLEAGTMGSGGEIFIFDMGDPVKILDLAKNMITQKGLKVGKDIKIEFSGLRPGEKLYEELLLDNENLIKTYNELIYIAKKEVVKKEVSDLIHELTDTAMNSFDNFKIVGLMKKIVPEFVSNHSEFEILDNND